MSKFLKLVPVMAVVASLSFTASAFATWSTDTTNISLKKNVNYTINGKYDVGGTIKTTSQALTLTDSSQNINGAQIANTQILNQAGIEDNSFKGSSGLVNFNAGSGSGFAQDNKVAISTIKGGKDAGLDAETFGNQTTNAVHIYNDQNDNFSILKNSAFSGFSGLANINVGTGSGYMQSNGVAISAGDGVSAVATAHGKQEMKDLVANSYKLDKAYASSSVSDHPSYLLNTPQNNAKVQNAFVGTSGLINANIGAGNGFPQSNNVAISAVNLSH